MWSAMPPCGCRCSFCRGSFRSHWQVLPADAGATVLGERGDAGPRGHEVATSTGAVRGAGVCPVGSRTGGRGDSCRFDTRADEWVRPWHAARPPTRAGSPCWRRHRIRRRRGGRECCKKPSVILLRQCNMYLLLAAMIVCGTQPPRCGLAGKQGGSHVRPNHALLCESSGCT